MKRTLAATAGAAALIGAAVIIAPAANATTSTTSTTSQTSVSHSSKVATTAGNFRIFRHDNYKGGYCAFTKDAYDLRDYLWTGASNSCNDGASSMKNTLSKEVVMYQNYGYTGRTYLAKANSVDADLTNNGFDNMASSIDIR